MQLEHDLLRAALDGPIEAKLDATDRAAIERSAATVESIVASHRTTYGINTGFGLLATKTIAEDQLATLQTNLILSHAAGVGAPMDDASVRLILLLKIAGLARGYSGVRLELVEALLALLNNDVLPIIPEKGSVGASGDLAPLAHLSLPLLGIGNVRHHGTIIPAAEGLQRAGIAPIQLRAKEGLALINGTQVSTALAIKGLLRIESVFAAAMVAGALSVDALLGSDAPFDPRIHAARGQPGQIDVAARYRGLLDGSAIRASHVDCDRVQDPYSLRCQPQVMGAALDLVRNAARTLLIEATAVTDNPLIFPDTGDALSGGNFHAEPVAMAADTLAIAVAEIGALSERRLALLIDPALSQLPAFLVDEPGLNSGFMIAQVTAAALASENKSLAHPASVDSLPTSANQEDHVSMATFAARRLADMAEITTHIVAIELLAACQGIDYRAPLNTSPTLQRAYSLVRKQVKRYDRDRFFAPDIEAVAQLVRDDAFLGFLPGLLP